MQQAIIWTNVDPIDWRIYPVLGGWMKSTTVEFMRGDYFLVFSEIWLFINTLITNTKGVRSISYIATKYWSIDQSDDICLVAYVRAKMCFVIYQKVASIILYSMWHDIEQGILQAVPYISIHLYIPSATNLNWNQSVAMQNKGQQPQNQSQWRQYRQMGIFHAYFSIVDFLYNR